MAVGFLFNQNMLCKEDIITSVDIDEDTETVVVRTKNTTNHEKKIKRKIRTSGCASGTIFGDVLDEFEKKRINNNLKVSSSYLKKIINKVNLYPSLYLKSGAIHGCVLLDENKPLVYFEDVGRHNAVDKISGYINMENINPERMVLYTTGRLTSEMIIKTVLMQIPILISRSGFTAWGVDLAKKAGLTLIGRFKGKRFVVLSGKDRVILDG